MDRENTKKKAEKFILVVEAMTEHERNQNGVYPCKTKLNLLQRGSYM